MNAYELADELAECIIDGSTDLVCVAQAANMLRQQADEFDKVVPQLVKANGLIENLRLRIAELEKQGEPVAWWTGKYEDEGEDFMFPNTRQAHIDHPESATHEFFPIPLYTTPQTKPLSDEKIEKILYSVDWAYDPVLLVKAIEKEHGIV